MPSNFNDPAMNNETVIEVHNVTKRYKLYKSKKYRAVEALFPYFEKYHTPFYSLRNINLKVNKGEIIGIIGKNGSGKSTLMKLIAGVTVPTSGTVRTKGNIVPLLELGSGFHPEFTGYENIYFYTAILGYSKEIVKQKVKEIIEFAAVGEFIDQPVKNYSSGMRSRLAFSVSINIDPDILILDEVLSVGDGEFKEKSYQKMREFFNREKTILFVSHSMQAIKALCTRAILLEKGELIMDDTPEKVIDHYEEKILGLVKSSSK
jgi:ABC-type polysaccharide/polyol phosphate transport system ATPase subunit